MSIVELSPQLSAMRRDYRLAELSRASVSADPLQQFSTWLVQARRAELPEPNAMTVATVDADGYPDSRVLLLKQADANGFVFYTNYQSPTGVQLDANPYAAMVFLWLGLERQVRIRGTIQKVSREQSAEYFRSRPRGSQIGALVSQQSAVVAERRSLEQRYIALEKQYAGADVPLPDRWGGYSLQPKSLEFWQGRSSRLHDRLRYRRADDGWLVERLEP